METSSSHLSEQNNIWWLGGASLILTFWQVSGFMTISGSRSSPSLCVINWERNPHNLKPDKEPKKLHRPVEKRKFKVKSSQLICVSHLYPSCTHYVVSIDLIGTAKSLEKLTNWWNILPSGWGPIEVLTLQERLPSKEIEIGSGDVEY